MTIQEAVIGNNSSYVWRSIMEARDLVLSRSRLKVGSGETIKVWTDPWIPNNEGSLLTSPVIPKLQDITVNNLLCPKNKDWDLEVLRDIFSEQDVVRIMRIPRSCRVRPDSWLWINDDKGTYSVKSGYKCLT